MPQSSPAPKDAEALQRALERQAMELQMEMERIRARREQLEHQRKLLQQRTSSMLSGSPITNISAGRSPAVRSASGGARPRKFSPYSTIPSEKERRQTGIVTQERIQKETIEESHYNDSCTVGGFFLLKDMQDRIPTFPRARRFQPLVGVPGQYYLAQDVVTMQKKAKAKRHPVFSTSNRGVPGSLVSTHWNDSKGGTAPGPGAYTPRYQKAAPPSRLAQTMAF